MITRTHERFGGVRKWDERFLRLAREVSSWSKDPSTQVGAVLVNNEKVVVGMGYNGFPRGVFDDPARYNDRQTKYEFVCHAEVNAILNAGHAARGATLYVWPAFYMPPICNECCKVAIQAGVKTIVGTTSNTSPDRLARWIDSIRVSRTMCQEAGISWFEVPMEEKSL